jgi:hypothetical protein
MLCQVTHLKLREHPYSLGNINESQFLRGGNNHSCSQWSYLMFQKCNISIFLGLLILLHSIYREIEDTPDRVLNVYRLFQEACQ